VVCKNLRFHPGARPRPVRRCGDDQRLLGKSDVFDQAVGRFALAYADQTARDHAALAAAVKGRRIEPWWRKIFEPGEQLRNGPDHAHRPITSGTVLLLVAATLGPIAPLLLTMMPLEQLPNNVIRNTVLRTLQWRMDDGLTLP